MSSVYNRIRLAVFVAAVSAMLFAQAAPAGQPKPVANLDSDFIDSSVSPASDFYEFANGSWRRANPIPAAYGRWAVFRALLKRTDQRIHVILDDAAGRNGLKPGTDLQRVADFYASGMDLEAIEAAGAKPLEPEFERIDRIADLGALQDEIGRLQRMGLHVAFEFGKMQDTKDSSSVIGYADQGGIGLPDRSYYLAKGKREAAIRDAYLKHVAAILELVGEPADRAGTQAKAVLQLETVLAKASMARVARRKPGALYHPMDRGALAKLSPRFDWARYFRLFGRPDIERINVRVPGFFRQFDTLLGSQPLSTWKAYLRWRLLDGAAPYLAKRFVDANFRFHSLLNGAKRELARWQRVVHTENRTIPFAVGKLYVQRYFPPQQKGQVEAIVRHIRAAFREEIQSLKWMSPKTRKEALHKEAMMVVKVGYPDHWPSHAGLSIDRGPWVLNVFRARAFQFDRNIGRIGKAVDRDEWKLPPQMVDAYYSKSHNDITVPAGILQKPWFDPHAPAAINYGAIGSVIGHEITHGFDDQGRKYNGRGNLADWWTKADSKRFDERARCISDQYSAYVIADGTHVKGGLVRGEAIADLGGIAVAYRAFRSLEDAQGRAPRTGSAYTPEQLFFLGFAHLWGSNVRPKYADLLARVDPHPPMRFRVNGTLANFPPFQAAFHVPEGSPMVNAHPCSIW